MENAADALKMAAWVLIFVVALTLSINSITQARQSIDAIVNYSDREYLSTYVVESPQNDRIVGCESIIPAMYRAFNENFRIIFKNSASQPSGYTLFTRIDSEGNEEEINYIDFDEDKISNSSKDAFMIGVLYGKAAVETKYGNLYVTTHFPNIEFNDEGLYSRIKEKEFFEKTGMFYIEESKRYMKNVDEIEDDDSSSVPDTNKTEKRVITYIEKNS